MDVQSDVKKITDAVVKIAIFGAQKLAKASDQIKVADIIAKVKASFDNLPAQPPSNSDLAKAIFQILSAIADASKNAYVQDLESLAKQLYYIFTGGQGVDFGTMWDEIKVLFNGKLKGTPTADPNPEADTAALLAGIPVVVAYIISKLPATEGVNWTEQVLGDIKASLDTVDATVAITDDEAMAAIYEVLDACGDLTGKHVFLAIQQILEKIYSIVTGKQSNFIKFFQSLEVAIKARIEAKKAAKGNG